MPLVSDRCICLRKVEYSETSQILTLFAREHGILRVIAKGAHRRTKAGASKFDGGIDLLDVGNAVFSHAPERELPPLTEWGLVEGHQGLRNNLRGMYLGLYAAELVAAVIEEHDPHPALFDRMLRVIAELGGAKREQVFLWFEMTLLREAGLMPQLEACDACRLGIDEGEVVYFSPERGGIICRNCEHQARDRIEVNASLVRMLAGFLKLRSLPGLTREHTDPLNRLIAEHVQHQLGKKMKMVGYVI